MNQTATRTDTRTTANLKDATHVLESGRTLALTLEASTYTIRKTSGLHEWRDTFALEQGGNVLATRFECWQLFNYIHATLRVPATGWEVL